MPIHPSRIVRQAPATLVVTTLVGAALGTMPAHARTATPGAFGSESLECGVGPNATFGTTCFPRFPFSPAVITFNVVNESGSDYSFSWTVQGNYSVVRGCASNTDYCGVSSPTPVDQEVIGTVVVSQNGSSRTLSATAQVYAVCKFMGQPVWC